MRVIGVTGGVGSGKSALLAEIEKRYGNRGLVLRADDIANEVKEPGGLCYNKIVSVLGTDILEEDGTINRRRMAERIFRDDALLQEVNAILHPAVRQAVKDKIAALREQESEAADGATPEILFIEAALLIEDHYKADILDELWLVHAPREIRRERLKENRGYPDEKIDAIFAAQQTDEGFLAHADRVIDNSGSFAEGVQNLLDAVEEVLAGQDGAPEEQNGAPEEQTK